MHQYAKNLLFPEGKRIEDLQEGDFEHLAELGMDRYGAWAKVAGIKAAAIRGNKKRRQRALALALGLAATLGGVKTENAQESFEKDNFKLLLGQASKLKANEVSDKEEEQEFQRKSKKTFASHGSKVKQKRKSSSQKKEGETNARRPRRCPAAAQSPALEEPEFRGPERKLQGKPKFKGKPITACAPVFGIS